MSKTRPSGLPIVETDDSPVLQEIAEVDERRRLHLLPRWTKRVTWLPTPPTGDVEALVVLIEPGLLSIRDWKVDGPRIEQRYRKIENESDAAALEAMRFIQDRYSRLVISKERRPYLGDAALAHLGLPISRGVKSIVYVAVFPDWIDVFSREHRNARLTVGNELLDDLP